MKPRLRRAILVGGTIFIAGFTVQAFLVHFAYTEYSAHNRVSAIKCTENWGRLIPFPTSAQNLNVKTTGGMFSRGFRITFTAPPQDIERWLKDSPGTREAKVKNPSAGLRHFQIEPGGGAQYAEVKVDDATHTVSIYVYWS